jgi:hypothetical protein
VTTGLKSQRAGQNVALASSTVSLREFDHETGNSGQIEGFSKVGMEADGEGKLERQENESINTGYGS